MAEQRISSGHRDKSSDLLQVLRQPLPSPNDRQLPDLLVRYIHPSPQAQIFGAKYNPKVPQRLKYSSARFLQSRADRSATKHDLMKKVY